MLTFIKNKLLYKKWLNLTLMFGIFMMITLMMALPMYRETALYKLFQVTMKEAVVEYNANPMRIDMEYTYTLKGDKTPSKMIYEENDKRTDEIRQKITDSVLKSVTLINSISDTYVFEAMPKEFRNDKKNLVTSNLSDMKEHIKIIYGTYPVDGVNEAGNFECIVSSKFFSENRLYLGQLISNKLLNDTGEKGNMFQIVGVFEEADSHDDYWFMSPSEFDSHLFVTMPTLDAIFQVLSAKGESIDYFVKQYVYCDYYQMLDKDARQVKKSMENLFNTKNVDNGNTYTSNYLTVADNYMIEANRLIAMIYVLQVPIVLMLIVFIFMIATELIGNELNEIAMLLSRGVSKKQVILVYGLEALLLSGIASVIAFPASYGLVYILSHTNAFLRFQFGDDYGVIWTPEVLLYAVFGITLSVLFVVLSCVPFLKTSIVEHKSKRNRADKPVIQKYFLDVILLGVSVYLLFNFDTQKDAIAEKIVSGGNLDPVVYISATLFMIGFGIVVLRIASLLKKGIYLLGQKRWKPSSYAAFLQMTRTEKKQSFISIFMVMTLAMGIFNANMANTIYINEREQITYDTGADYVIKEKWQRISGEEMYTTYLKEPDMTKYDALFAQMDSYSLVYAEDNASMTLASAELKNIRLLGITPKSFGRTANMKDGLTSEHWYHALNALSNTAKGVLISKSLADEQGIKVGDEIKYTRNDAKGKRIDTVTRVVAGIVEAFPSYDGYTEIIDAPENATEEELANAKMVTVKQHLIVDSFRQMTNDCGTTDYEIWIRCGDKADVVEKFIEDNQIPCVYKKNTEASIESTLTSSLIQITNGVLTMSFLVCLLLCTIGFLMYWILSIRERELLFGVYRAMGMTKKEIYWMLIIEQILSSVFCILCGVICGFVTSYLFMDVFTLAFSPEKHLLQYVMQINWIDLAKLAVIIIMMLIICFIILVKQIKSLNIVRALKLGEE